MSSDRDWRKWGKSDPYFGVVTWPEFRTDRLAENLDRFFESGRRDVLALMAQIDRLYGDVSTSERCNRTLAITRAGAASARFALQDRPACSQRAFHALLELSR